MALSGDDDFADYGGQPSTAGQPKHDNTSHLDDTSVLLPRYAARTCIPPDG